MGNTIKKHLFQKSSFTPLGKEDKNDKEATGNYYSHLPSIEVNFSQDDISVEQKDRRDDSSKTLKTHYTCSKDVS